MMAAPLTSSHVHTRAAGVPEWGVHLLLAAMPVEAATLEEPERAQGEARPGAWYRQHFTTSSRIFTHSQ